MESLDFLLCDRVWLRCLIVIPTFGSGTKTRRRRCDGPQHGGRSCPGSGLSTETQSKDCGRVCVPGGELYQIVCGLNLAKEWTQWSEWGACSVSRGRGRKTRERECVSPDQTFPINPRQSSFRSKLQKKFLKRKMKKDSQSKCPGKPQESIHCGGEIQKCQI